MNYWTDIHHTAFTLAGYPMSYVELVGTVAGLLSVWYASKARIATWPLGIVNEICLFFLFYQVHLYADMLLQVFFFVTTLYGWFNWRKIPGPQSIRRISRERLLLFVGILCVATLATGFLMAHLHTLLPALFPEKAAYPYPDSLVMAGSIIATFLLAAKRLENWFFWILTDVCCVVLYAVKGVYVLCGEFVIFLCIAIFGYFSWRSQLKCSV